MKSYDDNYQVLTHHDMDIYEKTFRYQPLTDKTKFQHIINKCE